MKSGILLLGSLALGLNCFAASNCDKPVSGFDGVYCLNKIYGEADKELNDHYGKLTKLLDNGGKSQLKQGQLAWMKSRNSQCSRTEGDEIFISLDCATRETVSRTQYLQDRLRECNSTGCLKSKL